MTPTPLPLRRTPAALAPSRIRRLQGRTVALTGRIARLASALEHISDLAARDGTVAECAEVARRAIEGEGPEW